jgi:TPR repeat protein/DNA-binding CsgD family transcriptional regulator
MNRLIIGIIFLITISFSYSQNNKTYSKQYKEFLKVQFSNPILAKKYLDSIVKIPNLTDSLVSKTYNDLGVNHAIVGNYPEAIEYFSKALYHDKKSSKKTKANILCNIANTQKMSGQPDLALQNLNKAQILYKSLNDKKNILKVQSELSAVHYSKADFNKALEISSALIPKLEEFKDKKLLNIQLLRMANIQFNIGDYKNAIANYEKTLPYFSIDIENNIQNKNIALMNIGSCYSQQGNKKALFYFNEALKGFRKISDLRNEFFCMGEIGQYYYKLKDYKKALTYLKKSFEYMYANVPHMSLEIFSYYINCLSKENQYSLIKDLLTVDANIMLEEANLNEKIFYFETIATINSTIKNNLAEYEALKKLHALHLEQQNENTFEELQKKLNQYNIKNEINKNRNLKLKISNLKLQNTIIWILILFTLLLIFYFIDKHKKKNKIQNLILMQLQNEKELNEKNNELKDKKLQLETEVVRIKERELTALQLKIFQLKSKIIDFLRSNINKTNDKEVQNMINKIESFFNNEDYWREFEIRFKNMHPDFIMKIKKTYPTLTKKDIDFLSLIKLNLNNKEIATLINISYESVLSKKYLLRKKMNLSSENELLEYVNEI